MRRPRCTALTRGQDDAWTGSPRLDWTTGRPLLAAARLPLIRSARHQTARAGNTGRDEAGAGGRTQTRGGPPPPNGRVVEHRPKHGVRTNAGCDHHTGPGLDTAARALGGTGKRWPAVCRWDDQPDRRGMAEAHHDGSAREFRDITDELHRGPGRAGPVGPPGAGQAKEFPGPCRPGPRVTCAGRRRGDGWTTPRLRR